MRLPSIKKILREDLGSDAPKWVDAIIAPVNSFMEAIYNMVNKNITYTENIASNVRELTVRTSSVYPVMDKIEFTSDLRTKSIGVTILQAYEKLTYIAAAGPVYAAWVENNGTISISGITGLEASKVYIIRFLIV